MASQATAVVLFGEKVNGELNISPKIIRPNKIWLKMWPAQKDNEMSCNQDRYRNLGLLSSYHLTVYPKKYAHGFVVLCFVVVMQSFIMNSHEVFIHIHQGCFAGTGEIVRLPQCQWSKPGGYGKISQCITTTKHSKAKTVCIFLWIYCTSTVASFTTEVNSRLAKRPLVFNGSLANHGLTSLVKEVSLSKIHYHVMDKCRGTANDEKTSKNMQW